MAELTTSNVFYISFFFLYHVRNVKTYCTHIVENILYYLSNVLNVFYFSIWNNKKKRFFSKEFNLVILREVFDFNPPLSLSLSLVQCSVRVLHRFVAFHKVRTISVAIFFSKVEPSFVQRRLSRLDYIIQFDRSAITFMNETLFSQRKKYSINHEEITMELFTQIVKLYPFI